MFLDDFPLCADLIQEYSDLRRGGRTAAEAINCLKNAYANERQDPDDGPLFWLGIAAAQEAWQETSADVVEEAERSLSQMKKTGLDVDEIVCVGQSFLRSLGLRRAKDTERKPPRNVCDWNIGDVFAVKMDTPCARAAYLDDTMLLLRVIRFSGPLDGLRYPFVYRMIWLDAKLPKSTKDINLAGYLRSKVNNPWEEALPPEHRVLLLSKSQEEFAKEIQNFMFVGNHEDALDPENDPMFDNGGLSTWISTLRQDACFAFHNYGIDYL